MWLRDYVQQPGVTLEALADRAEVDKATIWRAVHQKHAPHIDTARKISAATDGAVSVEEVYGPPKPATDTPVASTDPEAA